MYKLIRSAFIALFVSMIGIAGVSAADLGNGHIDENTTIKDSNDQGSVQAIQGGQRCEVSGFRSTGTRHGCLASVRRIRNFNVR